MEDQKDTGDINITELEEKIGYKFRNKAMLMQAMTHKSYANDRHLENTFGNERLEFLGDAVIELVVSHILMDKCADCSEGRLSKMRAAVVNKEALSSVSLKLGLDSYILLGKGEKDSMGSHKKSILANVYEALAAAVYYDTGFESAYSLIQEHLREIIEIVYEKGFFKDFKSKLQEYAQHRFNNIPSYIVLNEEGPDHIKIFEIQVIINSMQLGKGKGKSKKEAEQAAAQTTLDMLEKGVNEREAKRGKG